MQITTNTAKLQEIGTFLSKNAKKSKIHIGDCFLITILSPRLCSFANCLIKRQLLRVFRGLKQKYCVPWYLVFTCNKIVKTMVPQVTSNIRLDDHNYYNLKLVSIDYDFLQKVNKTFFVFFVNFKFLMHTKEMFWN